MQQYRFPIKIVTINGKEYIQMQDDIFYEFFLIMSEKLGVAPKLIKEISQMYQKAKKHKKKRIRLKKEKQALIIMLAILHEYLEKSKSQNKQNEES